MFFFSFLRFPTKVVYHPALAVTGERSDLKVSAFFLLFQGTIAFEEKETRHMQAQSVTRDIVLHRRHTKADISEGVSFETFDHKVYLHVEFYEVVAQ